VDARLADFRGSSFENLWLQGQNAWDPKSMADSWRGANLHGVNLSGIPDVDKKRCFQGAKGIVRTEFPKWRWVYSFRGITRRIAWLWVETWSSLPDSFERA
jgi:hypothetical protein